MIRKATFILVSTILTILLTAGCLGENTPTSTITSATSYYSVSSHSSYPSPSPTTPADAIRVYVIKVIDGDTIDVSFPNGTIERIRFLGVDTPETSASRNKPNEYDHITDLKCLASWGIKVKFFTRDVLLNKVIYIEFDSKAGKRGYYGRLLAYIYLENGTDFTALLIKRGYARVYTEGDFLKEQEYIAYQKSAESKKLGLWGCEIGKYADTSIGPTLTHAATTGKVVILKVHYDAGGSQVRDADKLNDEYVVLNNQGSDPVNLKGWTIMDEAGHTYHFPALVLQPGQEIVLHTGSGTDTSHDLYWGSKKAIWNNDHDTAYLYDSQGRLVDKFSW